MTNQEKDIRRLNLLGICHYVLGGFVALVTCSLSITLVVMGIKVSRSGRPNMTAFVVGAFLALLLWGVTICLTISGRKLRQCKGRAFSIIIAVMIESVMVPVCLHFSRLPYYAIFAVPFFILGIFTLITLNKKSVKELYKKNLCQSA